MEDAAIHGVAFGVQAIERAFREEARPLWRALFAYTGGRREIAEDAVAEAFARALVHAHSIRDPKPWLYKTAFRLAAGEMRRERRGTSPEAPDDHVHPSETGDVIAAVRTLSPKQRAAVVLHYYLGFPVREVAKVLGISPATVKVHLFRGRGRLRDLLGREESDD